MFTYKIKPSILLISNKTYSKTYFIKCLHHARAHYTLCFLINLHIAEQFDVKKIN